MRYITYLIVALQNIGAIENNCCLLYNIYSEGCTNLWNSFFTQKEFLKQWHEVIICTAIL